MTNLARPFTLRSAAGAVSVPPRLAESLLIVIDAQTEYLPNGLLALPNIEASLVNLAKLLDAARTAGAPIVHVLHQGKPGGLFDPAAGGCPIRETQAIDNEPVVSKTLPNAFAGTTLLDHIEQQGRPPLVIAGYMTHMCVSSTARAALDIGLPTTIVSDATATRALPSTDPGPLLTSEQIHRAALASLADRFSIVATTKTVVG